MSLMESDLEQALVQQIEKFLLELGRGFMFVGTQQRVTINNTHYYVDMVFYNKILRAYVLIELKTTKLTPEVLRYCRPWASIYRHLAVSIKALPSSRLLPLSISILH